MLVAAWDFALARQRRELARVMRDQRDHRVSVAVGQDGDIVDFLPILAINSSIVHGLFLSRHITGPRRP
jgi:hypothetical protein